MNVQTLIDILSDMNPDAEVKLAVQPEWAFQHSVGEVVSASSNDYDFAVEYLRDGDDEPELEECDDASMARCRAGLLSQRDDVLWAKPFAFDSDLGERIDLDVAEEKCGEGAVVYISEGGQDCYLPETAAAALGWSAR